jgi:hypothetical protein
MVSIGITMAKLSDTILYETRRLENPAEKRSATWIGAKMPLRSKAKAKGIIDNTDIQSSS